MDFTGKIVGLSDEDAETALNRLLVGLDITSPKFHSLLADSNASDLENVIKSVALQIGESAPILSETQIKDRGGAIRQVLLEASNNASLESNIHGALASNRKTLFDPITGALVLAGIVVVLSTEAEVDYTEGKLHVHVHRKASTEALIKKFFAFFK